MKKYIIKGDPIPLARPRLSRGHLYYAQKHQRDIIKEDLETQRNSMAIYEQDPLLLSITFFMPLPQVQKRYKEGDLHYKRPDLSNLIKMVEDAGLGILYKDDALISCIIARKYYSLNPRTEFTLEVVTNEKE